MRSGSNFKLLSHLIFSLPSERSFLPMCIYTALWMLLRVYRYRETGVRCGGLVDWSSRISALIRFCQPTKPKTSRPTIPPAALHHFHPLSPQIFYRKLLNVSNDKWHYLTNSMTRNPAYFFLYIKRKNARMVGTS